jgi:dihydrofolate reductase
MGAAVSLDGFIATDDDGIGPLFECYGNGDVRWSFPGAADKFRTTQATADFLRSHYRDIAVMVIGRRLFHITNGWNGKPPAGEHVFVVTHEPPRNWEHTDTAPFTFVDGVEAAIESARTYAGDRLVDAPQVRSAARLCGWASSTSSSSTSSRSCSARVVRTSPRVRGRAIRFDNPSQVVRGDRVTHLVFDVRMPRAHRA